MNYSHEGKELEKIRIDLDIKAKDFADALEVDPTQLSHMIHGRRKIPLELVSKMEEKFDVSRESVFRLLNANKLDRKRCA